MNPAYHERLSELFLAASDLDPAERAAFLDAHCGDDRVLHEEVDAMLAAEAASSRRLVAPVAAPRVAEFTAAPETIAGYRIRRVLGEGGMGTVYEAEQSSPRRTVALKVLRWHADDEAVRRFQHEAQVLGWLEHPGIARVYEAGLDEAGASPSGTPYLVMELVDGRPIDEYATRLGLDLEGRLSLVARVADAVHHAHQKGVVHRDLKPANVLVRDDGEPKVLDFGVARVARPDGERDGTMLTRAGEIVGTLGYMSPEQLSGDPSQVDTRADVYSLGVLAYELLSGRRPVDTGGVSLQEAMRRVAEQAPTPLGTALPGAPTDAATIVHKAIAKDKERRYPSAAALADDLRRFLRHEPIVARAPSRAYVALRFMRRHRAATCGAAATLVALVLGGATSLVLLLDERRTSSELRETEGELKASLEATRAAKGLAERHGEEARDWLMILRETNHYFEGLLRAPLPGGEGSDVRVVDVLDRAAREGLARFADQPRQRAWLAGNLARSFAGLGRPEDALASVTIAREAWAQSGFDVELEDARLGMVAARAMIALRRFDEAGAELGRALEVLEGHEGVEAAEERYNVHDLRTDIALAHLDFDGALAALDEGLAALVAAHGQVALQRPEPIGKRGLIELTAGDLERGIETNRRALAAYDAAGEGDSLTAAMTRNSLGCALGNLGRFEEAAVEIQASLERTRELVGSRHAYLAVQYSNLGMLHRYMERLDEADEAATIAVEISREVHGPAHPEVARMLSNRGSLRIGRGEFGSGERDLDEAIAILVPDGSPDAVLMRATAMSYRVPALRERGDIDGAEALVEEAHALKRGVLGLDAHPMYELDLRERAKNASHRGEWLVLARREAELADLLAKVKGPHNPSVAKAVERAERALARVTGPDASVQCAGVRALLGEVRRR